MDSESRTTSVGTRPGAPTLEEVSSAILLCRKNLGIYPPGHPRFDAALRALRRRLAAFEESEGVPFRFEAECVLSEVLGRDAARTRGDRFDLARMLQLRLVSAVSIPARADEREIVELIALLHDDIFKASRSHRLNADPGSWEDVALTFYEAVELPEGSSPIIAVLERAAGIKRHEEMEPLLADLREDVLRELREHLARPEFLRRVSRIRSGLRAKVGANEKESAGKIDLVSESLKIALGTDDRQALRTSDEILRDLDHFLGFAEAHIDFLAGDAHNAPDGVGSEDPTDVVRSLGADADMAQTGALVQTLKQRMGFLFRTARQPFAVPEESSPGAGKGDEKGVDRDGTVHNRLIEFPATARLPAIDRLAPAVNEVFIVLELLLQRSSGPTGTWEEVEQRLVRSIRDEGHVELATSKLVEFVSREKLRQARKLLYSLLTGPDENDTLVAELERLAAVPQAMAALDDFLGWLVTTAPRRGIDTIIALHKSAVEGLKNLANRRLLELGGDPELLTTWLVSDPDCVRTEVGRQYVLDLSPESVRTTFKHFFTRAPATKIASFLAGLPADLPGVQHILLAAVDFAGSAHRRVALRQLAAFPSDESVRSLCEIVKLNNLREKPDADETRAALVGLAGMNCDGARKFLHEIFDRRNGLAKYYKRAIRNTLREVLEQRDAKRCP